MFDFLLNGLRVPVAVVALFVTPFLAVRCIAPSLSAASLLALTGAASMAINTFVPVILHILAIPLTPFSLFSGQVVLFTLAAGTMRFRKIRILPDDIATVRTPALLCLAGVLLVIPMTPLAGIDTYKWQDLATLVQVKQRIPWLVHPFALLGFAPRAYPCAQPLTLATVQTLGGIGVESGYFLMSCLSMVTAIFTAYRLGTSLFTPRLALWFAAIYAFAPAAMRYHHWATGRGFFLAVLPLFILGLLGRTRRHVLLASGAAILLLLTHKTAIVAIPVLVAGLLLVPALRRKWRLSLAIPSATAALIAAGGSFVPSAGGVMNVLHFAATRFGVLVPLFALAVSMPDNRDGTDATATSQDHLRTKMLTLLLLLFPMAFTPDMYGTLLLLPLAAVAAVHGMSSSSLQWPKVNRYMEATVIALLVFGAVTIVTARNVDATPRRIREAALWLDGYDHWGPFRIVAPERVQGRMQAYVGGCPLFNVFLDYTRTLNDRSTPVTFSSPRDFITTLTAYLRNIMEPADLSTDWYGQTQTVYHVLVDGKGQTPSGADMIYEKNGVRIFRQEQSRPVSSAAP